MELKKIYLVRHCEAEGQSSTASLSKWQAASTKFK